MQEAVVKEGMVKKRGGRMHQWNSRYLMLAGSKLSYKTKPDSTTVKGMFDLVPGCIVTEVVEESIGTIKGKKMFSFWLVWPHDKHGNKSEEDRVEEKHDDKGPDDSDDEGKDPENDSSKVTKAKDLKQIVETEALTQQRQKMLVGEQLERHQAHDSNVSLGVKVAAVAVGGVVVGALTAGIGLIPYMTVVGITAVAGGGAVAMQFGKRPSDSRIIIACDSMNEAVEWKAAIEHQVARLEESMKPMLPSGVDPSIILDILTSSKDGGDWVKIGSVEGIRLMEQMHPKSAAARERRQHPWILTEEWKDTLLYRLLKKNSFDKELDDLSCALGNSDKLSYKAQLAVRCSSINAFLQIMNSQLWPKKGGVKVVREIDDHADIIGVETQHAFCMPKKRLIARRTCFNRFWKLDDEGIYLITLNAAECEEYPTVVMEKDKQVSVPTHPAPTIDLVITIAPRGDVENDDFEGECMVSCICQVSRAGNWFPHEMRSFAKSFVLENLVELQQGVNYNRFALDTVRTVNNISHTEEFAIKSNLHEKLFRRQDESALPMDTPPIARVVRRGVTTVQPGLEDASADGYNHVAVANAHLYGSEEYESGEEEILHHSAEVPVPTINLPVGKPHELARSQTASDAAAVPAEKKKRKYHLFPFSRKSSQQSGEATAKARPQPDDASVSTHQTAGTNGKRSLSPMVLMRGNSVRDMHKESPANPPHSMVHSNTVASGPPNLKLISPSKGVTFANNPTTIPAGSSKLSHSGNASPGSDYPPSPTRSTPSKGRDKKTNTLARLLRSQIGSTEYEIQRIERRMRKKVAEPNAKPDRHHITLEDRKFLQEQLSDQQVKVQELKQQYFNLTGEQYVVRSTFSRLRGLGRAPSTALTATNSVTNSQVNSATEPENATPSLQVSSIDSADESDRGLHKKLLRPASWASPKRRDIQRPQTLANLLAPDSATNESRDYSKENFIFMLIFVVSIVATGVLAQIFDIHLLADITSVITN